MPILSLLGVNDFNGMRRMQIIGYYNSEKRVQILQVYMVL